MVSRSKIIFQAENAAPVSVAFRCWNSITRVRVLCCPAGETTPPSHSSFIFDSPSYLGRKDDNVWFDRDMFFRKGYNLIVLHSRRLARTNWAVNKRSAHFGKSGRPPAVPPPRSINSTTYSPRKLKFKLSLVLSVQSGVQSSTMDGYARRSGCPPPGSDRGPHGHAVMCRHIRPSAFIARTNTTLALLSADLPGRPSSLSSWCDRRTFSGDGVSFPWNNARQLMTREFRSDVVVVVVVVVGGGGDVAACSCSSNRERTVTGHCTAIGERIHTRCKLETHPHDLQPLLGRSS